MRHTTQGNCDDDRQPERRERRADRRSRPTLGLEACGSRRRRPGARAPQPREDPRRDAPGSGRSGRPRCATRRPPASRPRPRRRSRMLMSAIRTRRARCRGRARRSASTRSRRSSGIANRPRVFTIAVQRDARGRGVSGDAPAAHHDPHDAQVPGPERDARADPGEDQLRERSPRAAGRPGMSDREQQPADEPGDRRDQDVMRTICGRVRPGRRAADLAVVDEARQDDAEDEEQDARG